MKLIRNLLLTTAALAAGASVASGAPWPPQRGDLLLGVQAVSGSGTTTNVLFNLGPAHSLRTSPNPTVNPVVNLNAELTAAFGSDWASRNDLYFGVIANRNNAPASGLGVGPTENGDPSRTVYVSRGAFVPPVTATLTTVVTGGNNDLVYTAKTPGAVGNSVTITYVNPAPLPDAPLSVSVSGSAITVNLATDGLGAVTTTASAIITAIQGSVDASALVAVANAASNNGSGVVDDLTPTSLSGGVNGAPSTATPWQTFGLSALGLAASNHQGQVNGSDSALNGTGGDLAIDANGNAVATLFQSLRPVKWNNGWTSWNPFNNGAPSTAYGIFNGGIQSPLGLNGGTGVVGRVDLFRIPGNTGVSSYVTTIEIDNTGAVSVNASSATTYFTLTGTATNGSIAGASAVYASGTSAVITATPAFGFQFSGWTGAASGTANPLTILMDTDKNVGATFTPLPQRTLTVVAPTNGTITGLAAGGQYFQGTNAQLTAVAATGKTFAGWFGAASGTTNPIVINMSTDKTVGALFADSQLEAQLALIPARFTVGQDVDIDLSFIAATLTPGQALRVLGLPPGLTFSTLTNRITGRVLGLGTEGGVLIQKVTGRTVNETLLFDLAVEPFRFDGSYELLLEDGTEPVGKLKVTISGPTPRSPLPTYSATLDRIDVDRLPNPIREPGRVARGTFTAAALSSSTQTVPLAFLTPPRTVHPAVTFNLLLTDGSDLVTSTQVSSTVTGRGFRLAKAARRPGGNPALTVTFPPDSDGDRTNTPGGIGHGYGSISAAALITLRGQLGDAQAYVTGLSLSQTNQAVVFMTPHRNTLSAFGGIIDIGILPLPGRAAPTEAAVSGLRWERVADSLATSYPLGFAPISLDGDVSRWYPMATAEGLAQSLGLVFRVINTTYVAPPTATPGFPTRFSLRNGFSMVKTFPSVSAAYAGSANRSVGLFTGTMRPQIAAPPAAPAVAPVSGVFLQDESFGSLIGQGVMRIPITAPVRGSYETVGIELGN